jgi:uncharacterized protein (TIGR00369 family)
MNTQALTGLEFIKGIQSGAIPPPGMAHTLGMELPQVNEDGRVHFGVLPELRHTNPMGLVHGGFYAGHLDTATGIAVHSTLGRGESFATVELSVKMLRGAAVGAQDLRAEGWVVHSTRNFAFAEGRIVDAAGTVYAQGTATCALFRAPRGEG